MTVSNDADDLLTNTWSAGSWGYGIGASNLVVEDLTGDGRPEIIAGAGNYWYVAGYDSGTYRQLYLSTPITSGDPWDANRIARIVVDEQGGVPRVLVAETNGNLSICSGWPLEQEHSATLVSGITDMVSRDLNGDGVNELIVSTGDPFGGGGSITIYDAQTLQEIWHTTAYGARDIAVGQLDGDAALEIVTNTGRVIDGITHAVEWNYTAGFGIDVEVGNLDADATDEILGSAGWYRVTAFDAVDRSPLWEISTDLDIGAIDARDIDGDGIAEVLIGDGQWGDIDIYSATTRERLASIENPGWDVTDVTTGDVDGDGRQEVIWASGDSPEILAVAGIASQRIEWTSSDYDGLSQVAVGDVDADGVSDIVVVSAGSDSGYDGSVLFVYDGQTHALKWQAHTAVESWSNGAPHLSLANIDEDPQLEIVIGSEYLYDGRVVAYDGLTHAVDLQVDSPDDGMATALAVGDADGNGTSDIVTGQSGRIIVRDSSGAELWRSVTFGGWAGISDIAIADVDADSHSELLATVNGDGLYVFDGVTHLLQWHASLDGARAFDVFDVNADGTSELVVGTETGDFGSSTGGLAVWTADGQTRQWAIDLGAPVDAVRGVVGGDGSHWLLATAGGHLFAIDPSTHEIVWESDYLGANLGLGNHLAFEAGTNGEVGRVWVGADQAVWEFSLSPLPEPDPDQSLVGTFRPEWLAGGSGNDTIVGKGGDDTEFGSAGADQISGNAGADRLHGGADDDSLSGGSENDRLWGDSGADTMAGGTGDDTYWVDDAGDRVVESAYAGTDRVYSEVSHTLEPWVDDLYLRGDGAIDGTGNALDNTIGGTDADNVLSGLGGRDILFGLGGDDRIRGGGGRDFLAGGSGDDTLIGGAGGDRMRGGDGADRFVFTTHDGSSGGHSDVILDYSRWQGDVIHFDPGLTVTSAVITAGGALLTLDSGNHIEVLGVTSISELLFI